MHTPHARPSRTRAIAHGALAAAIIAAFGTATPAHADASAAPARFDMPAMRDLAAMRPVAAPVSTVPSRPASSIVVANCDDDGSGSLRWALGLATDGDTIDLSRLTCSTITLTSGQLENNHAIDLVGPGADLLTIDGNASSRVLYDTGTLAISDLTLANGRDAGTGGCLVVIGAEAILTRVTVSGCVAGDGVANNNAIGGGIAVNGGALTLVSSRVSGNTARGKRNAYGGGIIVLGDGSRLGLADSRVDGNRAYGGDNLAFGGGLVVAGPATTTTFQDSVVENNRAISTAGAAIGGGATILGTSSGNFSGFAVHGGRISGNLAEGASAEGGGIVSGNVDAIFDGGSLVSANVVRSTSTGQSPYLTALGGGIFASIGSLALTDAFVSGNQVIAANGGAAGGGVTTYSRLLATRSAIDGNTVQSIAGTSYGGGISTGRASNGFVVPIELHACTIAGNTARSNGTGSNSRGGGVDAFGPVLATYSTIRDNTVVVTGNGSQVRGGGVASTCRPSSTDCGVTVRASTVSGNTASGGDGDGGGVAVVNGAFAAYNSTIAFNGAPSRGGGVIAAVDSASKAVSSIIAGNSAPAGADISIPLGASGAFTVIGEHNLIVDASGSVALPTDTLHADPKLLPLADNGGATATHALAECSPAVDAGSNPSGFDYDQRLAPYVRAYGDAVDIGAFERQPDADRIFDDGFEASPCS